MASPTEGQFVGLRGERTRSRRPLLAAGAIALVGVFGGGPAVAAGGDVAWASDRDGNFEIYVGPADGGGTPINVSTDAAGDFSPSLSSDGGTVAWRSFRDGNLEIYLAPADGSGAPINVSTDAAADGEPSLSADGGTVAWTSSRDGNDEIYVAPADGSGTPVNVSTDAATDSEPSLSADGGTVAWSSNRDGNWEVYAAPADGSGTRVNVSTDAAADYEPSLSADGGVVAWTSSRDGNDEIYVAPADGSGTPVNTSADTALDSDPSLSADGRTVAWWSLRGGNDEIYVTAADGTGTPVNVSTDAAIDANPSLSAEGGTVAWWSLRDGNFEIYVAAADGRGTPVNVSNGGGTDDSPSLATTLYTATSSIANGATITAPVPWRIDVTTIGSVDRVEFFVGGALTWTDRTAPYVFGGDGATFDAAAHPNGPLSLEARVFATPSATTPVASVPLTVTIANPGPPPPVCASVPAPTPSTKGTVELSVAQIRINQRIYSAGIRRAAAIERWLADGVVANDLCAGGLSADPFGAGITIGPGPGGPVTGAAPTPRPIIPRPAAKKSGVTFALSAEQLQINQRIASALVRRANGLRARLDRGLTGGDVRDGQIEAGKPSPAIAITGAIPVANPPGPTVTTVAPAATKTGVTFTLSARQLRINQRIGSAAIRRLNAARDRLLTGLADDDFQDDSISAVDLAPGVAP